MGTHEGGFSWLRGVRGCSQWSVGLLAGASALGDTGMDVTSSARAEQGRRAIPSQGSLGTWLPPGGPCRALPLPVATSQ